MLKEKILARGKVRSAEKTTTEIEVCKMDGKFELGKISKLD